MACRQGLIETVWKLAASAPWPFYQLLRHERCRASQARQRPILPRENEGHVVAEVRFHPVGVTAYRKADVRSGQSTRNEYVVDVVPRLVGRSIPPVNGVLLLRAVR